MSKKKALQYHSAQSNEDTAGKISIEPTKACATQEDLSLAYSPGVAHPTMAIAANPKLAHTYTNRGNLVAVISNGTAILGLGNQGALASKPVMEGKSVLFKRFAGVDAFDIELDTTDPDEFVKAVQLMEPTFGGINLEDIAAPDCFYIENQLRKKMNIPVFHDDQHGTAIISGAALLNALELTGKQIQQVKVVVSGAGAAGIRCAEHYVRLGVKKRNLIMLDSKGVLHKDRIDLTIMQQKFAGATVARSLGEAMLNADVFLGVSVADIVTPDMVRTMAPNPIVFALANPNPEITYAKALASRPDIIMATGRSDHPNQINNVLGFPFIFRGALDVQAAAITENMKVAATHALAEVAHHRVPKAVVQAYGGDALKFGKQYIVPKPFDSRAMVEVAAAVAKAAKQDGVAAISISPKRYRTKLERLAKHLQKLYG